MDKILLECGCVASSLRKINGNKIPCCGIHSCTAPAKEMPSLDNRMAECSYGCGPIKSSYNLAFFRYKPDKEYDEYFCGCIGWD